jgi:hypothetical protein
VGTPSLDATGGMIWLQGCGMGHACPEGLERVGATSGRNRDGGGRKGWGGLEQVEMESRHR